MELETFLAHHGVKGMKWGVRKRYDSLTTKQKLAEVQKEQMTIGQEAFGGEAQRAYYRQKKMDQIRKKLKDPELRYVDHFRTKEDRQNFERWVTKKAYRDIAVRTVVELPVVVALAKVGSQKLGGLNAANSNTVALGAAAIGVILTTKNIKAIAAAEKHRVLMDESLRLQKELKSASNK